MHTYKIMAVLAAVLSTGTVQAATEFDGDVPLEVVRLMVDGEFYSDLPDSFPDIELPDGLSVTGSLVNQFYIQAFFSFDGPSEEGAMALVQAFTDAGWIMLPSQEFQQPQNGFIYPGAASFPFGNDTTYCHDRYGTLTVSTGADSGGGGNLSARVSRTAMMQPGFSCREQVAQRQASAGRRGPFSIGMPNVDFMPRLVLPEQEGDVPPRFPGIFSGSSREIETNASLSGDFEVNELNSHFAGQLEEQGWELDADWSGGLTAGGNWILESPQGQRFLGVLSIIERNEDIFDLKFTLITRGGGAGAGAVGIDTINIVR